MDGLAIASDGIALTPETGTAEITVVQELSCVMVVEDELTAVMADCDD